MGDNIDKKPEVSGSGIKKEEPLSSLFADTNPFCPECGTKLKSCQPNPLNPDPLEPVILGECHMSYWGCPNCGIVYSRSGSIAEMSMIMEYEPLYHYPIEDSK